MQTLTGDFLRQTPLPEPDDDGDKDQRGRVLVIGGSVSVPGGALLAGTAALRAGAGKLQIATCEQVALLLGLALPEALVVPLPQTASGDIAPEAASILLDRIGRSDAVLIGPGMLDHEAATAFASRLLEGSRGPTFVLDAAPLVGLRRCQQALAQHAGRIVITPHAGEMAGLLDTDKRSVLADPLGSAVKAAAHLQSVVVLKGSQTHIVTPDGKAWLYTEGQVGLATSGSGDTLAGIIAGLLARGAAPALSAQWGVYLHGEAGNRLARSHGPVGYLASELLAEVPRVMAGLPGGASET